MGDKKILSLKKVIKKVNHCFFCDSEKDIVVPLITCVTRTVSNGPVCLLQPTRNSGRHLARPRSQQPRINLAEGHSYTLGAGGKAQSLRLPGPGEKHACRMPLGWGCQTGKQAPLRQDGGGHLCWSGCFFWTDTTHQTLSPKHPWGYYCGLLPCSRKDV